MFNETDDIFEILRDGKDQIDLEYLNEEYGIKTRIYPDRVVLNYDQIHSCSKRFHPVVRVCRQLILNRELNKVLHRSFDRFFNYGENPEIDNQFSFNDAICEEKLDGSLIGIYHDGEKWQHCSKSMAYAEGPVQPNLAGYQTFGDIIDNEVDLSPIYLRGNKKYSYICELVSPYDPHVTRYAETRLVLLAVRDKETGAYINKYDEESRIYWDPNNNPDVYYFSSFDEVVRMAKNLKDLEEGYVCTSVNGIKVKVKNPAHVAASHLKGDGMTPSRVITIVHNREESEVLEYFPQFKDFFEKYIAVRSYIPNFYENIYSQYKNIENQKEFALAIKDIAFNGILFQMRNKKKSVTEILDEMTDQQRERLYEHYKNTLDS